MTFVLEPPLDSRALDGSMRDFVDVTGPDLLGRTQGFLEWQERRRLQQLWSYSKSTDLAPLTECEARYDTGYRLHGINLGSQDYLSLSSHPAIKAAAIDAIGRHGVHSAGSPVLLGNTAYSVKLEAELCDFLHMEHCVLFPTGWGAGYSAIKGLVRPGDHVVMDSLSHSCLREGALAATRQVYPVTHRDNSAFHDALADIRSRDPSGAILVVTESLFSMDSDVPDIAGLQQICTEQGATLMVDVAHDLGALGKDGTGYLGAQNMLGKVDMVMGSFSKTFASNGGFILSHQRSVKEYLKFFAAPHIFSNALSPVQAAVVLAALTIVRSSEGSDRRRRLMERVIELRNHLRMAHFECLGDPSAIVPVHIGDEGLTRLLTRALPRHRVVTNLVEYPGVAKGAARLRLQVMADHTAEQMQLAAAGIALALAEAQAALREVRRTGQEAAVT